jgi:hypothetical protein
MLQTKFTEGDDDDEGGSARIISTTSKKNQGRIDEEHLLIFGFGVSIEEILNIHEFLNGTA